MAGLGGAASYWVFTSQQAILRATAERDLQAASDTFVAELTRLFVPATRTVGSMKDAALHAVPFDEMVPIFHGIATGSVRQLDQVNGIYLGFPDGSFIHIQDILPAELIPLVGERHRETALVRRIIDKPETDYQGIWEVREFLGGPWVAAVDRPNAYDPRTRPWYKAAAEEQGPIWTAPYTFASTGELGATYAIPLFSPDGKLWAIAGIDLSLQSLSAILLDTLDKISTQRDLIFATDFAQKVIGHPDFAGTDGEQSPDVALLLQAYQEPASLESRLTRSLGTSDAVSVIPIDGKDYLAIRRDLAGGETMPMSIFMARDLDLILADAEETLIRNVVLLGMAVFLFGAIFAYAAKLQIEVALRKRLQGELVEAKDLAEAATKAKSTFLATMSHEIRTPMNGVMSMAELLSLTKMSSEQRQMTRIVLDSAQSLLTIINDILDFSKIEAGKLDVESIPFSVRDTVYGTGELLVAKSDEKSIGLTVHVAPDVADSRLGDPTRIRQILLNLAGNAIKFTEAGEVVVRVLPAENGVRFTVRDTGIGLTEDQMAKLFKPFQQADQSTSRKFGGTGLGLSICHRLTELMGGRIGVESVFGDGSTFWFELPLQPTGVERPQEPPEFESVDVILSGLPESAAAAASETLAALGAKVLETGTEPAPTPGRKTLLLADPADTEGLSGRAGDVDLFAAVQRRSDGFAAADLSPRPGLKLTYPLSETDLRRALRITTGLEDAEAEAADQRTDLQFAAPDADTARAARAMVLVAEDNATNQIVIRQMLGRLGYACEIANNGREALEMLDRDSHGLLLSDFNMPEMDGFELTRAVRVQPAEAESRLPVIALTADAMGGTQEACEAAGMDAYLTKPVDSHALGRALEEFLPQGHALRVPLTEGSLTEGEDAGTGAASEMDENLDIFDPQRLVESFGALDADALAFAANFAADAESMVERFVTAADAGDSPAARHEIHALKGASKSVGAVQLGNIASDLQDMVDAGDVEMAAMLSDGLRTAREEFAGHIESRRTKAAAE